MLRSDIAGSYKILLHLILFFRSLYTIFHRGWATQYGWWLLFYYIYPFTVCFCSFRWVPVSLISYCFELHFLIIRWRASFNISIGSLYVFFEKVFIQFFLAFYLFIFLWDCFSLLLRFGSTWYIFAINSLSRQMLRKYFSLSLQGIFLFYLLFCSAKASSFVINLLVYFC